MMIAVLQTLVCGGKQLKKKSEKGRGTKFKKEREERMGWLCSKMGSEQKNKTPHKGGKEGKDPLVQAGRIQEAKRG